MKLENIELNLYVKLIDTWIQGQRCLVYAKKCIFRAESVCFDASIRVLPEPAKPSTGAVPPPREARPARAHGIGRPGQFLLLIKDRKKCEYVCLHECF